MKKIIVVLMLSILFLIGYEKNKEKKIDYSDYLFTNIILTKENGYDIETIILKQMVVLVIIGFVAIR